MDCQRPFYDLNRQPAVCPACGVIQPEEPMEEAIEQEQSTEPAVFEDDFDESLF